MPLDETGSNRRGRRQFILLCALIGLLGAVQFAYSQTFAFAWNEGFHLLAAQLIRAGGKPYIDFCFPQTPLNAYWTAAWMGLAGESWRTAHAIQSLLTMGAVILAAGYVFSRLPASHWRLAAAAAAALLIGLNNVVFVFCSIGQAYGSCLFLLVGSFRAAVAAIHRKSPALAAVAGALAGAAIASSLLTAAAAPALLLWIVLRNRAGNRRIKAAAFLAGMVVPCLPVLWLFVQGPRQTLFNLFEYHLLYRAENWHNVVGQDLDVLTSWINSGQAVVLGLLAAAGLLVLRRGGPRCRIPAANGTCSSELWLCVWLASLLGAESAVAHPTFPHYFVSVVPFLAILAAVGFAEVGQRMEPFVRPLGAAVALALLLLMFWGRGLYARRNIYTWEEIGQVARKTSEVTPPGAALWADEPVYFLTRRSPPSGMEFGYSHEVETIPNRRARDLRILPFSEIRRQVEAGAYSTIQTCDADTEFMQSLDLPALYRRHARVNGCAVYWDRAR
jgi:hypothetical protein